MDRKEYEILKDILDTKTDLILGELKGHKAIHDKLFEKIDENEKEQNKRLTKLEKKYLYLFIIITAISNGIDIADIKGNFFNVGDSTRNERLLRDN